MSDWNLLRTTIIELLIKLLLKELIKELREEIKEESEAFVISKCKEVYRKLLMTGPFTKNFNSHGRVEDNNEENKRPSEKLDNEIVRDRERSNVMGAIMH